MESELIHELPIRRFYYSMSYLLHISHIYDDDFPSDLIANLYCLVDNYYLESLSILRSSKKKDESVKKEIESKLKESRKRLAELEEERKQMSEDEREFADYQQASHVSTREEHFRQTELEVEMSCLAAIVMMLSLLESTLFHLARELIEFDSNLPKMHDVMSRKDNGIVKYLKYFERCIEKQDKQFIVGTQKYDLLMFWLKIRNNIVHNNNIISNEILEGAKRLNIDISTNRMTNKFRFKHEDIMALGNLCGSILDDCIEKGLYCYFSVDEIVGVDQSE